MLSPCPLELGTVDPDAMQNDSELAGDSGLGLRIEQWCKGIGQRRLASDYYYKRHYAHYGHTE
jgi:hypothetical protein